MPQGAIDLYQSIFGTAKNDFLSPVATGVDTGLNYLIFGYGGNDTLIGGLHEDTLRGGPGDDFLAGYFGDDFIYGGIGADSLRGGPGNDWLYSGQPTDKGGADTLFGGLGNDHLYAAHYSELTGGQGADIFMFGGRADESRITDFQHGVDKIDLSSYGLHSFDQLQILPAAPGINYAAAVFFQVQEVGAVFTHAFVVDNQAHNVQLTATDFIFAQWGAD